jgi:hypothetical protein
LPFWNQNAWLHATPALSTVADAWLTRGLVSLIGIITLLAGLGELGSFLLGRERRARDAGADAG